MRAYLPLPFRCGPHDMLELISQGSPASQQSQIPLAFHESSKGNAGDRSMFYNSIFVFPARLVQEPFDDQFVKFCLSLAGFTNKQLSLR